MRGMINNTSIIQQCIEISRKVLPHYDLKHIHWMNDKPKAKEAYQPTQIEHVANVITHGVAIIPSVLGTFELLYRSHSAAQFISALLYGATLILLFSVSTCFHCVFYTKHKSLKNTLHRCDRAMIYIFIAGSYFPWLTIHTMSEEGWSGTMKWMVWLFATMGIIYQQTFHEKYKCFETFLYIIMGTLPALPIVTENEFGGLEELKLGGYFYILGVVFFKADGSIPCAHAIWHVFVIIAAGIHYFTIITYLYPNLPLQETS